MRKRGHNITIIVMMWMLLSPSLMLVIDSSASGNVETTITSELGYFSSSEDLYVRNQTTLNFEIDSQYASSAQGEYSYSGIIIGNGTYQNNSNLMIESEYDGNITIHYNASDGFSTEQNKSLNIHFDMTKPELFLTPITNSIVRVASTASNSMINATLSHTGVSQINCNDSVAAISNISIFDQNWSVISTTSQANSLLINGSDFAKNNTTVVHATCYDHVGNNRTRSISIYIDDTKPQVIVYSNNSALNNQCYDPQWNFTMSIADVTTPLGARISLDSGNTWNVFQTPYAPPGNFSGPIHVMGTDGVDNNNTSIINFPGYDRGPPSITIQQSATTFTAMISDDCGVISSGNYRYQFANLSHSAWRTLSNNTSITYPPELSGLQFRTEIVSSDVYGQTGRNFSNWSVAPTQISLDTSRNMSKIGSYVGTNIYFIATAPSGGTFTTTTRHSVPSCASGSSRANTSLAWNFQGMCSGTLWLNVTTTDQYGQTRVDTYTYLVDAEVTSKPILSFQGLRAQVASNLVIGPSTNVSISNILDAGGVGATRAECLQGSSTNHDTYTSAATIYPSSSFGNVSAYSLRCRIVDQLGNIGMYSWLNASIDQQVPSTSLDQEHSGSSLTPTSMISAIVNDTTLNGTSTLMFQYSSQTNNWSTVVTFNGSWNGTISSFSNNITDGTLQVTLYGRDYFGNTASPIQRIYAVNTTIQPTQISLDTSRNMSKIGSYVGTNIYFIATAPSGGTFTTTTRHSVPSCASGSSRANTSLAWNFQGMCSGTLWLNVTTTDQYGQTRVDTYTYLVDAEVTSKPTLSPTGAHISIDGELMLGPGAKISVNNIIDVNGIGKDYAECYSNISNASTQLRSSGVIVPNLISGGIHDYRIRCRVVDLLGNVGEFAWLNTTIDLQAPTTNILPYNGLAIAMNTPIVVNSNDSVLNGTSELKISWTNGSSSWNGTLNFNGTWSGSIGSVNNLLGQGNITVVVRSIDWFGNVQNQTVHTWYLNTTFVHSTVNLNLSSGMSNYGMYIGGNLSVVIHPPAYGQVRSLLSYANGTTIHSENSYQNTTLEWDVSNMTQGTIRLNILTIDRFGRSGSKTLSYIVDNTVVSVPSIVAPQGAISYSGRIYLGPNHRLAIGNFVDQGGVGVSSVECIWNSSQGAITLQTPTLITPPGRNGFETEFSLRCRIFDLLGNIGEYNTFNGSRDLNPPTISSSQLTASVITKNTTIFVQSVDGVSNGTSQISLNWSNGIEAWQTNVDFNGSWTGTIGGLNSTLGDGVVQMQILGKDAVNNQVQSATYTYTLNTTAISSSVSIDNSLGMISYGRYITNVLNVTVTPPSGGSFNFSFESDDSQINILNNTLFNQATALSFTNLSQGTIWLNITTVDAHGRVMTDVHPYEVDLLVGTLPSMEITTLNYSVSTTVYTGEYSTIFVNNFTDNQGGVGYERTECQVDNGTIFSISTQTIQLYGQNSVMTEFLVKCRNVDHLSNSGEWRELRFTTDAKAPSINNVVDPGTILGQNSSIAYTCSDEVPSFTEKLSYVHQNQTQVRSGTLWLNGTQPSLSQMNLLSSGQLSLTFHCKDMFGNTASISSSALSYTDLAPYSVFSFAGNNTYLSQSGLVYVGKNMTFEVVYSENNNGNGTINMTLFRGNLAVVNATSTSTITVDLSNLTDGTYRVEVGTCSALSCSQSQHQFVVDKTGPGKPFLKKAHTTANIVENSTVLVGLGTEISMVASLDNSSGVMEVVCSTNVSQVTRNINTNMSFSPYLLSMLPDQTLMSIECRSYDLVNNPSDTFVVLLSSDFTVPSTNLSLTSSNGYIFPDHEIRVNCTDTNPSSYAELLFRLANGSVMNYIISSNTTYSIWELSSFYNQTQVIDISGVCRDLYGNSHTKTQYSIQYSPNLGQMSINYIQVVHNAGVTYVGEDSAAILTPVLTIGTIQFKGYESGSLIWQKNVSTLGTITLNETDWNSMFSNATPGTQVQLIASQIVEGTSQSTQLLIGNLTQTFAPFFNQLPTGMKANGTLHFLPYSTHQCSTIESTVYYESQPNSGSITALQAISYTPLGVNVTMPFGVNTTQNFRVQTEDCLGNTAVSDFNITRDIIPPALSITGTRNGIASRHTTIIVNVSDNSGIVSVSVILSNNSMSKVVCSNSCEMALSDELNFSHNQSGYLHVFTETQSGQSAELNLSFIFDDYNSAPRYSLPQSTNQSGLFIGLHSNLTFITEEDSSTICLTILGSSDSTCVRNDTMIQWSPDTFSNQRNITLRLNATDLYGNQAQDFITYTYIPEAPNILSHDYKIASPGVIEVANNAQVPYTISLDGSLNVSSSNSSLFIDVEGRHTVNLTIQDQLGYARVQTIFILLDTTSPSLSLIPSTQSYIGPNSTLNVTVGENIANITEYTISISDGIDTCSNTYTEASFNIQVTKTLDEILGISCGLNSSVIATYSLTLRTMNEVGRNSSVQFNTSYYGSHAAAIIVGANISQTGPNILHVSEHSLFVCATIHPIPTSHELAIVGGNYSKSLTNYVSWNFGNATVTCQFTDILGNTWQGSWNIRFVQNDTVIQSNLLNNSNMTTQLGMTNLEYSVTGTGTINNVHIVINGHITYSNLNSTGRMAFNLPDGLYVGEITAVTVHGYSSTVTFEFYMDGTSPTITINEGPFYLFNAATNAVTTRSNNITINTSHADVGCGDNSTIAAINGTIMSASASSVNVLVNSTVTDVTLIATDCVGWRRSVVVSFERVDTIENYTIQNITRILITPNSYIMNENTTFQIQFPTRFQYNLTCATNTGVVNCTKVATNRWEVNITEVFSNGTLAFEISDIFGNHRMENRAIQVDNTAPVCEYTGVYQNTWIFLNESLLDPLELRCRDATSPISHVSIRSSLTGNWDDETTLIVESNTMENITGFYGNLTDGWVLSYHAIDALGNVFYVEGVVVLDEGNPTSLCNENGNNLDINETYYIPHSTTIQCESLDQTTTTSVVTLHKVTPSGNQMVFNTSYTSRSFTIPFGVWPDKTELILTITSEDMLGHLGTSVYAVTLDKVSPTISIRSYDNQEMLLTNNGIYHAQGKMIVEIYDYSATSSNGQLVCDTGQVLAIDFSFGIGVIALSPSQLESCGQEAILYVSTSDEAGNQDQVVKQILFDRYSPSAELDFGCSTNTEGVISLTMACSPTVSSNDDTSMNQTISLYVNDNHVHTSTETFSIDLSSMESYIQYQWRIVAVDEANRITTVFYTVELRPEMTASLSLESCSSQNIRCQPSEVFSYDYMVTGSVPLSFEVSSEVQKIDLIGISGEVCAEAPYYTCVELVSLSTQFTPANSGYWTMTYYSEDSLGRTYAASKRILVVLDRPEITLTESHPPKLQSGAYLSCEVCNITIHVDLEHEPLVLSNAQNIDSIRNFTSGYWEIRIDLSAESLPYSTNIVTVDVIAASGNRTFRLFNVERLGKVSIVPSIGGLECSSGVQDLIDANESFVMPNRICLFTQEGLSSDEKVEISLNVSTYLGHESAYTITATECFIAGPSQCDSNPYGPYSTQKDEYLQLSLKKNSLFTWQEYQLQIHTVYTTEPIVHTIAFIERSEFVTELIVDNMNTTIEIYESGLVNGSILLQPLINSEGETRLNVSRYLDLLENSLTDARCEMVGRQYNMNSYGFNDFGYDGFVETGLVDCELKVSRMGNMLYVKTETDWTNKTEIQQTILPRETFHLFMAKEFVISYTPPYETKNESVTIAIEQWALPNKRSGTSYDENTCRKVGESVNEIGSDIDGTDLLECYKSFTDPDGIFAVGYELHFKDGQRDLYVRALCHEVIPKKFEDQWLDRMYLESKDNCESENVTEITEQEWELIEIFFLACDIRCKISGDQLGDGYLAHAARVDDSMIRTNNARLYGQDSGSSLALAVAFFFLGGLVLSGIVKYWRLNERFANKSERRIR